ncbi:hypothetical protein PSEUBRA_005621 [Kalmanozyma brasiliensis GHG001]|uniref:Uncharacterized protein n=1 Tax=Kalmanozyma brasiliensis (strain GHG001) TaxID=1365824 RepID=V5EQX5_KALBG|nr:uncharacterized protein PSEUBRA_005621 [Kalmanozyma brasiliensis GHG001]EST05348.1 hypothetical protein PSEUBRA_005621 [Kalmanozyma brasiliensis GHG001]
MRISGALLLVLAAINMANAGVIDSVDQPKHKLVRVKNGGAHVNALNTARVDLTRQHSAAVAARDTANVDAAGVARADVKLKHVASYVHTLSASLESEVKLAEDVLKITDLQKAKLSAGKLLEKVEATLSAAVTDLHGSTQAVQASASAGAQRRTILLAIALVRVAEVILNSAIPGVTNLVTLLRGLNVDQVLEGDVVSLLTDVKSLQAIHDVANVDTVLSSILAIPASVPLIELLAQLENPESFLKALTDIDSLTSLIAAAPGGIDEIAKLKGSSKLVSYIKTYGIDLVYRFLCVSHVDDVLKTILAVPGSVQLIQSLSSIADVPAFVSGLTVCGVVSFVSSIKAVEDVVQLASTVAGLVGGGVSKRDELLDGVDTTLSNVGSTISGVLGNGNVVSDVDDTAGGSVDGLLKRDGDLVDVENLVAFSGARAGNVAQIVGRDAALLPRTSQTITLLSDSIDQLYTSTADLLTTVVRLADAITDNDVSKVVKTQIVPLAGMVGLELASFVHTAAPTLQNKVNSIVDLVGKVDKSLP